MSETIKIIAVGVSLSLIFISIAVCKAIGAIIKNLKQQEEEK